MSNIFIYSPNQSMVGFQGNVNVNQASISNRNYTTPRAISPKPLSNILKELSDLFAENPYMCNVWGDIQQLIPLSANKNMAKDILISALHRYMKTATVAQQEDIVYMIFYVNLLIV